ncbi:hypothetical protein KSP39_PZI019448 [Platanthera zijinensis]|uniref:Uncharacterized protein n=1 Tax=Platanthera zijinensis TaxID=2320716 RepID=A0AAP0B196_9ASPA
MVSSVETCSEAGRPSSEDFEPRTAFLRQFRAPDVLPPAIPSALLHRTPKQSAAFQNCSPEIYFKTALSGQQLFNPPELSQTDPKALFGRAAASGNPANVVGVWNRRGRVAAVNGAVSPFRKERAGGNATACTGEAFVFPPCSDALEPKALFDSAGEE